MTTYLPGSSELLNTVLRELIERRGALGVISFAGLLWSASGVFSVLRRSLNRAFEVEGSRPWLQQKLIELSMVGGLGVLLTGSLAGTAALSVLERFADSALGVNMSTGILLSIVPVLAAFIVAMVVYEWLPRRRVPLVDVWPVALLVALVFEAGKRVFLWYTENLALGSYSLTYGPLAAVVLLLVWIHLSAAALLFGAELASELAALRRRRMPS